MDKVKCPVKDCRIRVDLVLRSSDQVFIGAHKANLNQYSGRFPSVGVVSTNYEVVAPPEDGATLNHLMQYMHRQHYPEIQGVPPDELFNLAEAAEKYEVHSAVAVCRTFILTGLCKAPFPGYLSDGPLNALSYAIKHRYLDIADAAAPYTLTNNVSQMKAGLNDEMALFAWLQYKMRYVEEMSSFLGGDHPRAIASNGAFELRCSGYAAYTIDVRSMFCSKLLDSVYGMASDPAETLSECFDTMMPECLFKKRGMDCICQRQDRLEDAEIRIVDYVKYSKESAIGLLSTLPAFTTYLYRE